MAPISAHLLQTNDVMHSTLCTQQFLSAHLLQTEIFTRTPWHRQTHTHTGFYARRFLHRKVLMGRTCMDCCCLKHCPFFWGGPCFHHIWTQMMPPKAGGTPTRKAKNHMQNYILYDFCAPRTCNPSACLENCVFASLPYTFCLSMKNTQRIFSLL